MDGIPSSVMAAVAGSAAAGKNPWLPFGLLLLLAAPDTVPSLVMDTRLHDALHALGPAGLLYGLGAFFLVLSILESLADKLPPIERWLVPVSTAWRPFAGIAVSALIAIATARATPAPAAIEAVRVLAPPLATADLGAWFVGTSVMVASIVLGTVYGFLSTVGKTGTRLLLSLVPLPALRLAHSFLDDLFALVVCVLGFAHATNAVFVLAALLYLCVGLVTGPLFLRLTLIHLRIGWALLRKAHGWVTDDGQPTSPVPPAWLAEALRTRGVDPARATCIPAYAYRAPVVGWVRGGWLVFAPETVWFASRVLWRARVHAVAEASLARLGLAQSTTARIVTLVDRSAAGGLRETALYLYPAEEKHLVPALERACREAGLVRVRSDSDTAREGLPGYALRERSSRYLPAEKAGSLRAQALTTVVAASVIGVLSGGIFIPIGAGYALSPHPLRALAGLFFSLYFSLFVLGSAGLGWPVAVLYATLLNVVALRDLARLALRARIDGFVDKRAFLPPVSAHVYVPPRSVRTPDDAWRETDAAPAMDGGWRSVLRWLDASLDRRDDTGSASGPPVTQTP
jgi:hypothetical protein